MKYIKSYENNLPRILVLSTSSLANIKEILHSAKKYNIKTNIYIDKSRGINDSIVTFPEIYENADSEDKYIDFIKNGWGNNFYAWMSIKYITNTFIYAGTNLEDVILSLAQNKYNL